MFSGNLGDYIKSHSGREYKLRGRCRSVLVECLKTGILDPYLRPIEPIEASVASAVAGGVAQEAETGDAEAKLDAAPGTA